ncbi:MAG: GNAT family N-acetyltransferase [Loktanella sp.]|jgi:RimJ/RimL family protein N-acetyltransferase|nr:GNAT family N-acetyltransferase [Loktanella sp.]MDO7606777.1 GNAT family N-acetyltransferase [Loktanella sp.]MDO7624080.1 GNAT family N-acetyltransferase [Loktanella sp.]MDO7624668.1 GNAT family N-acetyltransferase [Loktanella sp.]MDO7629766.1 GNAT family N-acetyltransferase [Loktanella sp.]
MSLTNAPVLVTKNLTLRGPQKSDLPALTQFVGSERMEKLGWAGSEGDAWRGFIAGIGHWQWHGYGFFVIEDNTTHQPIGRTGILNHIDWPEPELAYHMFDGFEGKSLCYEAAVAVRAWAGSLGLSPLISMIVPRNTRSLALAARLGAVEETRKQHDGEEAIILRHLAHDHPTAQAQLAEVMP